MNLVDLISQLEEAKFLRLFRHLVDQRDPTGEDRLHLKAEPASLNDAELWVKHVGRVGSMSTWAETWAFQVAHLPTGLWAEPTISNFMTVRLSRAFDALSNADNARQFLLGRHIAADERFLPDPTRCTYHLFTNVVTGLDEKSVTRLTSTARRLFEERFGSSLGADISFGLGTPETVLAGPARKHAETVILDLLNMPSSYYLLAREGEIAVIPATEHGAFYAYASGQGYQGATSTSSLPESHPAWGAELDDLQLLINSTGTQEADLQRFFEEHPQFLFALDERYCEIRPHVGLIDGNGVRLVPDFLVRLEGMAGWKAIELKHPRNRIIVGDERNKAAKATAAAVGQLLTYRDFFASHENRRRISTRLGCAPYEPCLLVVIGRGSPNSAFRWRTLRPGVPEVEVVTYDFLFERAKQCAGRLDDHRRAQAQVRRNIR